MIHEEHRSTVRAKQPVVVRGTVRPRETAGQMFEGYVDRKVRRVERKVRYWSPEAIKKRASKAWNAKVLHAKDVATFGPMKRKLLSPFKVRQAKTKDAGLPQTKPGCASYIGLAPRSRPLKRNGLPKRGWGICVGCGASMKTKWGKIPKHEPGPPPFTECRECGIPLWAAYPNMKREIKAAGGSYTPIDCPRCYDKTERDSIERGTTSVVYSDEGPDGGYVPAAQGGLDW